MRHARSNASPPPGTHAHTPPVQATSTTSALSQAFSTLLVCGFVIGYQLGQFYGIVAGVLVGGSILLEHTASALPSSPHGAVTASPDDNDDDASASAAGVNAAAGYPRAVVVMRVAFGVIAASALSSFAGLSLWGELLLCLLLAVAAVVGLGPGRGTTLVLSLAVGLLLGVAFAVPVGIMFSASVGVHVGVGVGIVLACALVIGAGRSGRADVAAGGGQRAGGGNADYTKLLQSNAFGTKRKRRRVQARSSLGVFACTRGD